MFLGGQGGVWSVENKKYIISFLSCSVSGDGDANKDAALHRLNPKRDV